MTLFSSYLYGLVSRAHELCPSLGMSHRLQRFPPSSVCLTKPLRGTLLPSPRGPGASWGALGCSACCFHPCSSPFFCQTAYFQEQALAAFPGFRSAGLPSPHLPLPGQNVYMGGGGSTDLCSCIYRRDRLLCVCFSPSLQEPVTVSSHVVTISSLTPATSYNCSVTTFSHNSPSVPTFIAVSTMGKQHFPALFFLLHLQHLFLFAFQSCSW